MRQDVLSWGQRGQGNLDNECRILWFHPPAEVRSNSVGVLDIVFS